MPRLVAEKPRPIVAQAGFHVFVEDFFGLKEMAVAVDNHHAPSFGKSLWAHT
jgi:hypothetical protein